MCAHTHAPEDTDPLLSAFGAIPPLVDENVFSRFAPHAMLRVVQAIQQVWSDPTIGTHRDSAVLALLHAAQTWMASGRATSREAARTFWIALTGRLFEMSVEDPAGLTTLLLNYASEHEQDFVAMLSEVWSAISILDQFTDTMPDEARALIARPFAAILPATDGVEVAGSAIVPAWALRLVCARFGLTVSGVESYEAIVDGQRLRVRVVTEIAQRKAVEIIEATVAASAEDQLTGDVDAAEIVRVEVDAEIVGEDVQTLRIPVTVDLLYLLPLLSGHSVRAGLAALAAYYDETDAPELAGALRRRRDSLDVADPASVQAAWRGVYRDHLCAPHVWMHDDVYRAFTLLRDAGFSQIWRMAGLPERWRADEDLATRTARIRGSANSEQLLDEIRTTWGPFRAAIAQWIWLARFVDIEGATEESARSFAAHVIAEPSPYGRVTTWALGAYLLQMRPDLRDLRVQFPTPQNSADAGQVPTRFEGTYGDLFTALLLGWWQSEGAGAPSAHPEERGAVGERSLMDILHAHEGSLRLYIAVSRLTYRALITDRHLAEAAEGNQDGDSGADVLFAAHLLATRWFGLALRRAASEGVEAIREEFEAAADLSPLSVGRSIVGELFMPEAMGIAAGGIEPSLTLLLELIEIASTARSDVNQTRDAVTEPIGQAAQEEQGEIPNAGAPSPHPFWWTDEVEAALRAIAEREPHSAATHLSSLAIGASVRDRFGSLLVEGEEQRAARLILDYGGPASDEADDHGILGATQHG